MRTNYFYSTKDLDSFELGTKHSFLIYDVDIFRFRKATPNQIEKYGGALKDIPKENFISTKHYRSVQKYEGVVVGKHKATTENEHDTITVMFRTIRGCATAKCEVGLIENTYYGYPDGVKRNIEKYEEYKRPLIKSVIKLDKKQLIEYYKLVYKPMSRGGNFITDSAYENMKLEIRELIRINPNINPLFVRETDPLYFFDHMNYFVLAEILCKYLDTQLTTAKKIADEIYRNGVEAAKKIPITVSLFPGVSA